MPCEPPESWTLLACRATAVGASAPFLPSWVEARKGHPAMVKSTERGGTGVLRIDFEPAEDSLDRVSWQQFFETFDASDLAFLYQEKTANGRVSRFNKFIRSEAGADARREGADDEDADEQHEDMNEHDPPVDEDR